MNSEILTPLEIRRYSKQISLPSVGLKGQERIKKSKVLVIGAGGKGTSVMQNLVVSGLGKLGISDNFLVEEDMVARQTLYGNSDTGKQKAIISRIKLGEINELTEIELHNICLDESNIDTISADYDILVDATDNFPAHYLINDAGIRLKKPVVYGHIFESEIGVTVFNYKGGPSFRNLYPRVPKGIEKPVLGGIASFSILTHLTGGIMAQEVLKIILDLDHVLTGKLLVFNLPAYRMEFRPVNVKTEPSGRK